MKRNTGIDIIIPVYNALEDLKLCVESIMKHTDLSIDRVVFIDDKSPDENILPYLKSLEQPGIVVLQNEQNRGFSGSVNHGLTYSDRDVLLLNTDTIVTERWIEKITACAYSDPAIGTVTPFSNNATLCSIPNFCEENTIPYGLSIDEYAQIIERCSMRKYPRITVAVGFCMFIKREVIDKIGLFDEETFKRGYGEENDFCWRAEQLGYYHVLCDDTYIYHSGSASFVSDEKKKLMADHERILLKRFPKQIQENAEYVRDNPHQYLRSNVDIYAKLHNGKKNILYVLHMDFRTDSNNNIGGTQFHVKDMMTHLRKDNNVFVLARDGELLRLTAYLEDEQIAFKFRIGKMPNFQPFHSARIAQVYREILKAFLIDIVHVHHAVNLSFDIFTEAKAMGIPLLLTMHDLYYICPTIKLMENGKTYCGGCGSNCAECLQNLMGYAQQVPYLSVWREECRKVLGLCDAIITPSKAAKEIYTDIYPEIAERICVVAHGVDASNAVPAQFRQGVTPGFTQYIEHAFENGYAIDGWALQEEQDSCSCETFVRIEDTEGRADEYHAMPVHRADIAQARSNNKYLYSGFSVQVPDGYFASGDLKLQIIIRNGAEEFHGEVVTVKGYVKRKKDRRRVAFLGGLSETKGSQIAYQMMKQGGNTYDWYIVGGMGDPDLITLEKSNVFKTGWYRRENIGAILRQNQIDLVCIFPILPETYCYTLSEAEISGIPVLATDIGALGERLRQDQTGWLIAPDAPVKEFLKTVDSIFADQEQYTKICENAAHFRNRTVGEMCEDYAQLYAAFAAPERWSGEFDVQAIYNAYVMCQADQPGIGDATDMELVQRVNELEATLLTINQSLEYRMVKFFNRENMPFKRQIKWLIGFAYRVYKRLRR